MVGLGAGGGNVGAARRAGAGARRRRGRGGEGVGRAGPAARVLRRGAAGAGYATGEFRIPKILAGPDAMTELAQWPCDVVLNGVVGSLGLAPTLAALRAGRTLALANKESLVAGGAAGAGRDAAAGPDRAGRLGALGAGPVPAVRARADEVRRLVLTASGGRVPGRAGARSWPTSRRSRRWPTRPGTWGRSSRSTRPRWSTRASR